MGYRYGILGAGRQGSAAAYDLARFGDADVVRIADANADVAHHSADRVNALLGRPVIEAAHLDVRATDAVAAFMHSLDVCLSAVPYHRNERLARQAIAARCSFCDLGGNSDVVLAELALDATARDAGVAIVPDCGVGPGMISNLAAYAIDLLDRADHVRIYDGGLLQKPRPPFNYAVFFNIEGLTNEYCGNALYIEDGVVTEVPAFAEREDELVDIPQLGTLEAFVTSGALTTMARSYAGRLQTLKNKTLRHPGHAALIRSLIAVGMLDTDPVAVRGALVAPRDLLHELLIPRFAPQPDDRDLMVIHIIAEGESGGRPATVTVDLLDRHDDATGFSAMERTTGFHIAIVAGMIARGEVAPGAIPLERATTGSAMVAALTRRNIAPEVRKTPSPEGRDFVRGPGRALR